MAVDRTAALAHRDLLAGRYLTAWAGDPTMAMVLTEFAGAEPWCLGQALVSGSDRPPGAVRAGHPWAAAHGVDAVLVHHRGAPRQRPAWIGDGRHPVTLAAGGARLVQALPDSEEGPDSVPADQAIARDAQATLVLAPGRHLCRGLDDADRPVWQRRVDAGDR